VEEIETLHFPGNFYIVKTGKMQRNRQKNRRYRIDVSENEGIYTGVSYAAGTG
jgi:hypothetical protein